MTRLYGKRHSHKLLVWMQSGTTVLERNLALPKNSISSLQSLSVSDSLRPHGLQHTRPPCPSPTLRAYSNSCPSSRWCHSTISSSVVPFSSCLQSFPTLGSFQMSQFFASGGQNIGVSASVSVLPMNIQDWLVGSPCSPRDSQESSPTPQFTSINCLALSFLWWIGRPGVLWFMGSQRVRHDWATELNSFLYSPTLTSIHDYWKNHSFD